MQITKYRVYKKVYCWKILVKITSAKSWRKLSVNPISLTLFRTSLYRFVSRKCVTKRHLKNGLRIKMSHYTRCLNYLDQNKEYVVQAFKVLKNLVHAEETLELKKLDFSPLSPN